MSSIDTRPEDIMYKVFSSACLNETATLRNKPGWLLVVCKINKTVHSNLCWMWYCDTQLLENIELMIINDERINIIMGIISVRKVVLAIGVVMSE